MEIDGTESLLNLVDQLRRKAERSNKAPSNFKKRTARRSQKLADLAASAFSEGDLQKALDWLSEAINILPSAPLYTKRCIVRMALQHNILAAADAVCAIGTDPNYASGYLCGAFTMIRLSEYDEALKHLEILRRCFPNSKNINSIYVSCRNTYWMTGKIQPLEPPISIAKDLIQEEYSAFEENKLNDLKVELSSSGVLEASKLTEDFVRRVIETYKHGVYHLPQKYVIMILKNVLDILRESPNIVSIDISTKQTLTVVGDLRGKFNNLLSIFRHNRSPHFGRPYLFNGNVIGNDRMSLPLIIVVLCLKILFPEDVFINRGSEECLEMCETNGFETEVSTVYDEDTMKGFSEVFNWLPLAHILNNNVLIIHGGLFEDEKLTLADVQEMKRWYQPPDSGPICDILHSDPWNYSGILKKGRERGVWFGPDVTERFCLHNCIDYVVRSHQDVGEFGYEVQTYRQCLTVDSSTKYATYLIIRGRTSSFKSIHARKDRYLPQNCKCFLVCNCKSPEDQKLSDPLHDEYVTTNLSLPTAPAILKDVSEESQASEQSLLSKSDQGRSVQSNLNSNLTSTKVSSKPIVVHSGRITPRNSEIKVPFNPASPSLTKTESGDLPTASLQNGSDQTGSLSVVSANHPAPLTPTSSKAMSGPPSASKLAESKKTSNSQFRENLTSTTSSANVSVNINSSGHTSSKANLEEITQVISNSDTARVPSQTKDNSEGITRTLFISSTENLSSPMMMPMAHSPKHSRSEAAEPQENNTRIVDQSQEIVQTLESEAPEVQRLVEDIRVKPISTEDEKIEQNPTEDDNELVKIELLDEPNARTSQLYSQLAGISGKYTM